LAPSLLSIICTQAYAAIEDLQWRHAMASSTDVRHIDGIFFAPRRTF
jgi:hypothetical protein